ncbi:MAG: multiheme c-type cytochrome [Chthoniobacterales bacterium]
MLRVALAIPLLVGVSAISAKEVTQSRENGSEFVGAIGCRSSSCHGGAGPKREQYTIWSRQDFHAKAFAILTDARSARIAETIGGGDAPNNARCTICHSPFRSVAPTRLASTAHPDEGVSCESCHGAAGAWLRGHTRPDWTYAMRVSAGMRDLRSLYVRANTCVACHQHIDDAILKAGHPTMVFELDRQSIDQPRHWHEDDPWIGARAWLTGQAIALREAAWHARVDVDLASASPFSGRPAPDTQETSLALAWLLARVTATDPALPKIVEVSSSNLEPLQREADELAQRAAIWKPNADSTMSILRALAGTDLEFTGGGQSVESLFYRARRIVLALDRLSAALNAKAAAPLRTDNELKTLRDDVRPSDVFNPAQFAQHLRAFRGKL